MNEEKCNYTYIIKNVKENTVGKLYLKEIALIN